MWWQTYCYVNNVDPEAFSGWLTWIRSQLRELLALHIEPLVYPGILWLLGIRWEHIYLVSRNLLDQQACKKHSQENRGDRAKDGDDQEIDEHGTSFRLSMW